MKTKLSCQAIRHALTGPSGSIRTPFHRDGSIDYRGLASVIETNIANGSRTALLTAGDSHFACLTDKEIAEITKFTVKQVRGRALIVTADRYYDTRRAVEFAKFSRRIGVDVYMVMPPDWGHSLTVESLAEHYNAVGRHIPVMLVTNVFIPRGMDFGMRALKHCLAKAKSIVAVKDDFCGEFGRKMAALVSPRWAVWSGGLKQNHLDIHPHGCDGYLSTFITFKPALAHQYWSAIQAQDLPRAKRIIRHYETPWIEWISKLPGGFDAGIHGMLEISGLAKRWRRKPYYSLNDRELEQLRGVLIKLNLL